MFSPKLAIATCIFRRKGRDYKREKRRGFLTRQKMAQKRNQWKARSKIGFLSVKYTIQICIIQWHDYQCVTNEFSCIFDNGILQISFCPPLFLDFWRILDFPFGPKQSQKHSVSQLWNTLFLIGKKRKQN